MGTVKYGTVRAYVEFNLNIEDERERHKLVESMKEKRMWQSWVKSRLDDVRGQGRDDEEK